MFSSNHKDQSGCSRNASTHERYREFNELNAGADTQPVGFKWIIEGFSKLTTKKIYSEIFYLGGVGWRLLIFPKGNTVDSLSIYLDVADPETKSQDGWSIDAQFSINMVNQIDDKLEGQKECQHLFNARESTWGFARFMLLPDLYDPHKGYLMNDTRIIEVIVEVESVTPPKKITNLENDKDPPSKIEGSADQKVQHIDQTDSANKVPQSDEPPSKNEGPSAARVLHIDPTDSTKVAQSEDPPKNIDVSSSEKSLAKGHSVTEEHAESKSLPTLFSRLGSLKLRNPPYSLPNGYRVTEGAILNEGDMAAQIIQSALLSSELQPLVELPEVDLANQGYYHLAKFLHYHCASIISAQGLQIKNQENANVLEEIKSRDLEIQKLHICLEKSALEASQLRGDLEKAKEEKIKVVDEFTATKEKIIDLEGELQLLRSENEDLQIQLEDARQAERNA